MFDFKPPQFLRSEKRASQKQLAAALRESATKVRHASSFGEVVDAVLDIPSEHIDQKLLQLAKAHPQADVGDLEKILTKRWDLLPGSWRSMPCRPRSIFWGSPACRGYVLPIGNSVAL